MTTKACDLLVYLPDGTLSGLRTATVRNQTCRVSVAPPGRAAEFKRFELQGGAVVLTWRDGETPGIGGFASVDDADGIVRHLHDDVSMAIVTNDHDLLSSSVFEALAAHLGSKLGTHTGPAPDPSASWTECLGADLAETALLLVQALGVPGF